MFHIKLWRLCENATDLLCISKAIVCVYGLYTVKYIDLDVININVIVLEVK